jgi:hypothetical protein
MKEPVNKLRAKFFRDEEANRDMIEIKIIGDPNTLIRKVSPQDVERWPNEWSGYQAGKAEIEVKGTSLMEVPGIDKGRALAFKLQGVRTAEELAGLDEAAAKGLGLGTWTLVRVAKAFLAERRLEALEAMAADAPKRGPGRPPKTDQPEAAA